MLPALAGPPATSPATSVRATVSWTSEGPEVVALSPTSRAERWVPVAEPASPAAALEIRAADGVVLDRVAVPDARHRSIVLPEGGGHHARVARALSTVELPWPAGADHVRGAAGEIVRPSARPMVGPARPMPPDVVALQQSGPSSDRLDLVLLGDGYTASEQADFADDADRLLAYLRELEPYDRYQQAFNIWRVDRVSAESGATDPSEGLTADTAFACAYDCAGIERLICCDDAAVLDAVEASVPAADGVIVLVNSAQYGGSGGFNYATAYMGGDSSLEVAAHELGHSLVGLWDEYAYGSSGPTEVDSPNCSADPEGSWDEWLDRRAVDAFPVCSYDNLFRPTEEGCMMRTLSEGYCPVCRQEVVLAIYEALPSLVAQTDPPAQTLVQATAERPAQITVSTHVPADLLEFDWSLDGIRLPEGRGADGSLTLPCDPWGFAGELSVVVRDPTPWVRSVPLEEMAGPWPLEVRACVARADRSRGCGCSAPAWSGGGVGGWLALPLALSVLLRRRRAA